MKKTSGTKVLLNCIFSALNFVLILEDASDRRLSLANIR